MSDTPGAGRLSDDLADAERRAREAVENWHRVGCREASKGIVTIGQVEIALDRLAAVCRLAGRWAQHCDEAGIGAHVGLGSHVGRCGLEDEIRAELARLMADL